ncbi:hypothetical protein BZM27_05975 [Paraburkholderia steynii]|uniref:Uncharacterized protein n=1 Tax=Paraburkholderia steynii TaxID=1245441 RepID=A0A4R0XP71_9BURK|nr:hypothetical protein BZM27_05975 [Paraburkholderia steynii]
MKAMTSGEKVAQLEARIAELERLVGILTRERDSKPPAVYGPLDRTPTLPGWPMDPKPFEPVFPLPGAMPTCGKCGITLSPVMGYCCSRTDCPCGLGGVTCTTTA